MAARGVGGGGAVWKVSGEGYATVGGLLDVGSRPVADTAVSRAMLAAALCSDAVARDTGTAAGWRAPRPASRVNNTARPGCAAGLCGLVRRRAERRCV